MPSGAKTNEFDTRRYVVEIVDTFPFPAEFAPIAHFDSLEDAISFAKASLKLSRAWNDFASSCRTADGVPNSAVEMTEWLVLETDTRKILYDTSQDTDTTQLYRYPTDADLALVERVRRARSEKGVFYGDIDDVRALVRKGRSE